MKTMEENQNALLKELMSKEQQIQNPKNLITSGGVITQDNTAWGVCGGTSPGLTTVVGQSQVRDPLLEAFSRCILQKTNLPPTAGRTPQAPPAQLALPLSHLHGAWSLANPRFEPWCLALAAPGWACGPRTSVSSSLAERLVLPDGGRRSAGWRPAIRSDAAT